jgi:hypothetical protein
MTFHLVKHMDQVLDLVLVNNGRETSPPAESASKADSRPTQVAH